MTTTTLTRERDVAVKIQTVDSPQSSTNATRTFKGARLTQSVSSSGVKTSYSYDDFGRPTVVTNGRGNTIQTHYDDSGRVDWTKDGANNQTDFAYYEGDDSGATTANSGVYPGRVKYIDAPPTSTQSRSYFTYNDRGETTRTWGHAPYPTENLYDGYGQRTTLRTFRSGTSWDGSTWPSSPPTPDETIWSYDPATGLLNSKTYEDNTDLTHTYTADGKLLTRTWARQVGSSDLVTSYHYYPDSSAPSGFVGAVGELSRVTYSDGTPTVAHSYDRLGRHAEIEDTAGRRAFGYDATTRALKTETFTSGMFAGGSGTTDDLVIKQIHQGTGSGLMPGRWAGVQIGTASSSAANYDATYGYDSLGRLVRVTGPGL